MKGFVTETVGSKKAIISYNKTNSDGSVPSPFTLDYVVSDNLIDFINNDCIPETGKSDECYYKGEVESNYLKFNGNSYIFRIYHKKGNSIKIIANDPYSYNNRTDLVYGIIGACKYSGCCNGGRYYYQGLGGHNLNGSFSYTMDNVVNSFYSAVNPRYVENQYISGTVLGGGSLNTKVALMSKNDYSKVANCNGNNCYRSYLTNNSNAGKNFWLIEITGFNMNTSSFNYGTPEAHVYNNYVNSSSYAVATGGSYKAYGGGTDTASVVTDTNKVRPTLQLKNAKIIGGNGTKANPFIVK